MGKGPCPIARIPQSDAMVARNGVLVARNAAKEELSVRKKRVTDGTKILVDLAKDFTDTFPPIKSCLEAVSVLMGRYDVRFHLVVPQPYLRIHSRKVKMLKKSSDFLYLGLPSPRAAY